MAGKQGGAKDADSMWEPQFGVPHGIWVCTTYSNGPKPFGGHHSSEALCLSSTLGLASHLIP